MFIGETFAIAATGGFFGFVAWSSYLSSIRQRKAPVLFVLIVLALATAVVPNVGQQLYNIGVSFNVEEVLEGVSYFIFTFSIVGAWMLLAPSRMRWLLIAPILIAFAQPLLWVIVITGWSVGGFAP